MTANPLTILRTYALKEPSALPSSILFRSTEKFYTIFDAYPKSIFHFLVLPRLTRGMWFKEGEVENLKALLRTDKDKAKELLEGMKAEAVEVKKEIEQEMREKFGFRWDVWMGFHAVPSMVHLHLHVLSADLVSEKMKNKKHYNSFHPSRGFFLHIDDVLSWFEAEPSYFNRMARLDPKPREALLKHDLECFECYASFRNMPLLKEHLQEEWDKLEKKAPKRPPVSKRKAVEEARETLEVLELGDKGKEASSSKRAKTDEIDETA